ncbi:hypothetical protein [Chryseobacterium flavum]|uniref:hypothetical protein n=1 Tax=Chryseobacterium flavum TaxID=415851 RepID=UPI0028AADBD7|nr:hypothetical protein [Chryseobacterium flavum]
MRLTYLTFLFAFFGLLLNCNNTKLKESEPQKAVKQTEIKEIFSLVKPVNKPEEPLYTTLYNGYSISIQSDSSHQELIFKKGNVEIKKTLKFYYENPEIVFHLYKSDLDNTETKGFKFPKAEIIKKDDELKCKFFLGNKLLSDKTYDIPTIEKTSSSKKDIIADANQSTTPSDLKGTWAVICENELTELEINKNEGYLSLYDFNAIYINLKVEKVSNKNEYLLKYASLASQQDYYKENLKIIDEEISKDKVIGKLILQKNGKAELQWTGLYNMKKQKLEFVGNDFLLIKENGGKTPLILEPCK